MTRDPCFPSFLLVDLWPWVWSLISPLFPYLLWGPGLVSGTGVTNKSSHESIFCVRGRPQMDQKLKKSSELACVFYVDVLHPTGM